jgi:hypothetical protein
MSSPPETRKGTHSPAGAPNPETQGQSSKSLANSKHESLDSIATPNDSVEVGTK